MSRVMADCRRFPSESNCTLTIIGDESEVVPVAVRHAVDAHGHEDTPELRAQVTDLLEPADRYEPGKREPEPFPG
jgi:Protein of unknown function (DUF1059)